MLDRRALPGAPHRLTPGAQKPIRERLRGEDGAVARDDHRRRAPRFGTREPGLAALEEHRLTEDLRVDRGQGEDRHAPARLRRPAGARVDDVVVAAAPRLVRVLVVAGRRERAVGHVERRERVRRAAARVADRNAPWGAAAPPRRVEVAARLQEEVVLPERAQRPRRGVERPALRDPAEPDLHPRPREPRLAPEGARPQREPAPADERAKRLERRVRGRRRRGPVEPPEVRERRPGHVEEATGRGGSRLRAREDVSEIARQRTFVKAGELGVLLRTVVIRSNVEHFQDPSLNLPALVRRDNLLRGYRRTQEAGPCALLHGAPA